LFVHVLPSSQSVLTAHRPSSGPVLSEVAVVLPVEVVSSPVSLAVALTPTSSPEQAGSVSAIVRRSGRKRSMLSL
jgi:hypothetical protein